MFSRNGRSVAVMFMPLFTAFTIDAGSSSTGSPLHVANSLRVAVALSTLANCIRIACSIFTSYAFEIALPKDGRRVRCNAMKNASLAVSSSLKATPGASFRIMGAVSLSMGLRISVSIRRSLGALSGRTV
jgi:hypothetical protein